MARDFMKVMRHDIFIGETRVYGWLEYFYFQVGEFSPSYPANQLLSLAREHRAADDFNASCFFCVF